MRSLSKITLACIGLVVLCGAGCATGLNESGEAAFLCEVLEPSKWVGKRLPILGAIDIGEQLGESNWIVLFYHHDCEECVAAFPMYEQEARDLAGGGESLKIAFVSVPPHGESVIGNNSMCIDGHLANSKDWFLATPTVALLANGNVMQVWEGKAPGFEVILQGLAVTVEGTDITIAADGKK